jgi:hypothetical protein
MLSTVNQFVSSYKVLRSTFSVIFTLSRRAALSHQPLETNDFCMKMIESESSSR